MSSFANIVLDSIIMYEDTYDINKSIYNKKTEILPDLISVIKAIGGDENERQKIITEIKETKDWPKSSRLQYQDSEMRDSILMLCIENMYNDESLQLAQALVENKMYDPSLVNKDKENALMVICRVLAYNEKDEHTNYAEYLAKKIIEDDSSTASQVDISGNTALILACRAGRPELVRALIQTGNSMPDHVNNQGDTALIIACKRRNVKTAIEVIRSNKSNPSYVNPKTNKSAIDYARQNKLTSVLDEISAIPGLAVASAVQLRTTEADVNRPITERKGYRDEEDLLNPSAPKAIEKHIQSFLPKMGGRKTSKRITRRKARHIKTSHHRK